MLIDIAWFMLRAESKDKGGYSHITILHGAWFKKTTQYSEFHKEIYQWLA